MKTFANYREQRDAFMSLLAPECEKRILLFSGESGTGKTALMMTCQHQVCVPVYHVPIQLRNSAVNVAELFFRAGSRIGWGHFPHFSEQVAGLSEKAELNVNIQKNKIKGMGNMIKVALTAENPNEREERRVLLTEAWFDDIREMEQLLLVTMDTYEDATTEMQEWVSGPFLFRVADCDNIRVAMAGQEVPDRNNIEWGHCCDSHELYGVKDAEHWLPVVRGLGHRFPDEIENPKDWLAGICHALNGRPNEIMKIIQGLPRLQ